MRRVAAVALSAAMVASMVTGCGSSSDSSTTDTSSTDDTATTDTDATEGGEKKDNTAAVNNVSSEIAEKVANDNI